MADNKQLQQVNQASWNVIDSFRETGQTFADSLVAIQDRNLKFAQNVFLSWMDLLSQQTESMQHLQQEWGEQVRTQQDTLQKLASSSMQIYMDFLLTPFSFSRRVVDVTEDAVEKGRESARKASRSDNGKD